MNDSIRNFQAHPLKWNQFILKQMNWIGFEPFSHKEQQKVNKKSHQLSMSLVH